LTQNKSGERESAEPSRLEIRPQARGDIAAAHAWYERQRPGLGEDFIRAVDAALAAVREQPKVYARVHGEIRRATVQGYPYGVFYLAEPGTVVVLAVTHHRRHPRRWRGRR
jgi:plasmid stabilization system protein ParE